MKKFKKIAGIFFSFATMIVPSVAVAGQSSGPGKINALYMNTAGSVIRIEFNQTIVNPDQCGGENYYILEITNANQDRYISVLMSAFYAGKTVGFWVSGCTSTPYWGATRPVVADIYVYP